MGLILGAFIRIFPPVRKKRIEDQKFYYPVSEADEYPEVEPIQGTTYSIRIK